MQVEQGTKHPEAGPWLKCTQMFTVVIGYQRNYQIRVIKLIRGSKNLKNLVGVLHTRKQIYDTATNCCHGYLKKFSEKKSYLTYQRDAVP